MERVYVIPLKEVKNVPGGKSYIYYHPETKRRVVVPFHKKDSAKGTLGEMS